MSQDQMMCRIISRVAKRPLEPKLIKMPVEISREPEDDYATVRYEEQKYTKTLNTKMAWRACQELMKDRGRSLFRLSTHPNSSISVLGIKAILSDWERDGWVPDVVVIDYADILAPPSGILESRDQINITWKQLRSLSQSMHCLVVTATQAAASSYKGNILARSNFSDDKRKLAHVVGMCGINVSSVDKERGTMRLNWVVLREWAYSDTTCCHVAGCLDVARPAIKSTF